MSKDYFLIEGLQDCQSILDAGHLLPQSKADVVSRNIGRAINRIKELNDEIIVLQDEIDNAKETQNETST